MLDLISLLIAIRFLAKDVHYKEHGYSFWGNHLLADKIADGLLDFVDEINESAFLGHQTDSPDQENALVIAAETMKTAQKTFEGVDGLIIQALTHIEIIKESGDLSAGDEDLLGRISNDLQSKHGLLWRRTLK